MQTDSPVITLSDELTKALADATLQSIEGQLNALLNKMLADKGLSLDELKSNGETVVQAINTFSAAAALEGGSGAPSEIYMGKPTEADFQCIQSMTVVPTTANDWSVYCYRASDNLLNLEEYKWTWALLDQMAEKYVGHQYILDHRSYSSDSSMGFIIQSKCYVDTNPSAEILDAGPHGDVNRAIIQKEGGYKWLMLKCAVPRGSAFDIAAQQRKTHYCSTGFFVFNERDICPNCSEQMGREVEFLEQKVVQTEYGAEYEDVCPHTPPSDWLRRAYKRWGDPAYTPQWADWMEIDGDLKPVELSGCTSPCLPAAQMLRTNYRSHEKDS